MIPETGPARRRARLESWYGKPGPFDTADALRLLGIRDQVHPRDAHAFLYRSAHAAEAWQHETLTWHGVPSLGVIPVEGGAAGVYDLRPELAGHGIDPTDPALPDTWKPPGGRRGGRRRAIR